MTSIDSVVRSYLGDKGANTLHGYIPLLHYALECFDELHYDVIAGVKTAKLTLNDIKVASLPSDYIQLIRVVVKAGDRWVNLDSDGTIAFHKVDVNTPNEKYHNQPEFHQYYNPFNPITDPLITENNGRSHNGKGYFREKKGCKELHFSADVTSSDIYVEYIGQASSPSSETVVTPLAKKCINRYIGYRDSWRKNGEASAETQYRKQEYLTERDKVTARESNLSLESIANALDQSYGENMLR